MASKDGRIQDFLRLVTKSPQAPMSGSVSFNAKVSLPTEKRPFLEKVELQGDFGVDAGSFTKSDTQPGVNSLSRGVATFSNLSFGVPGALAQMQGTYNLISEKIDLHGTLKTRAEVSKTTHGVKALILKVLDPFFKNKPSGYIAPVKITGTYDHPAFGSDLGDRDHTNNQNAKIHPPRLLEQAKH
jgi:hypothetical protein